MFAIILYSFIMHSISSKPKQTYPCSNFNGKESVVSDEALFGKFKGRVPFSLGLIGIAMFGVKFNLYIYTCWITVHFGTLKDVSL